MWCPTRLFCHVTSVRHVTGRNRVTARADGARGAEEGVVHAGGQRYTARRYRCARELVPMT